MEFEEKARLLRQKLRTWAVEYYDKDAPTVSDREYDLAMEELKQLELLHPNLITPDSPTQVIGGKADHRFTKLKHKFPMLSLGNAFNENDVLKFMRQAMELTGKNAIEIVAELKIDGLSISLIYDNGKLIQGVTRGDGTTGEDVTHNVLEIKDIPKTIPFKEPIEFRGEIYMPIAVFDSLNASGNNFANPRNAAAGTLRQLDSKIVKLRELASFIYSIPNPLDYRLTKHTEVLEFINKQGFSINKETKTCSSATEALKTIEKNIAKRDKLPYDVDGTVLKINDILLWDDIGFTAKAPKFMIAYKFPEEVANTKLLDIFPTIGRTGRVTYNAKLSPVQLAGSTVIAATLHNANYIKSININVGDMVSIKKAGDIIPKVTGLVKKNNKTIWKESSFCPFCNSKFIRMAEEVDQYCPNESCSQRIIAQFEHFTSRNAMDIRHLSTQTIKLFLAHKLISDLPSLFELPEKVAIISKLPFFGKKSVNNLVEEIEKARKQDLGHFLFGLGIRYLGEKLANTLAKRFNDIDQIMKASSEELMKINDFGQKVSTSIVEYFQTPRNIAMIQRFKDLGLILHSSNNKVSESLEGQTFVITGTLSQERNYFKNLIESHGGMVSSTVSSKTSFLLIGEQPGSKLTKARELGIKIINEKEFIAMIG